MGRKNPNGQAMLTADCLSGSSLPSSSETTSWATSPSGSASSASSSHTTKWASFPFGDTNTASITTLSVSAAPRHSHTTSWADIPSSSTACPHCSARCP